MESAAVRILAHLGIAAVAVCLALLCAILAALGSGRDVAMADSKCVENA